MVKDIYKEMQGLALPRSKPSDSTFDVFSGKDLSDDDGKHVQGAKESFNKCDLSLSSYNKKEPYQLDGSKIAYHLDRVESWLRGEKVAPITIDWALTRACNYHCTFCYAELQDNDSKRMTPDVIKRTLNNFAEIGVKGTSFVSDGESTVHPFFYDAISYGKKIGLDMAVATNGSLLDHVRLPQLLENLTYLRFNFSAGTPQRYAEIMGGRANETIKKKYIEEYWPKVVENVSKCVKIKEKNNLDVTLGLQMVLMPQDADQINPLAELGVEKGVDYVIIKHCSDDEFGTLGVDYSEYGSLTNILEKAENLSNDKTFVKCKWSKIMSDGKRDYHQCFGPPFLMQLSGSSLVAPCGMLFNERYKDDFHIGSIVESSFKELWQGDRYWEVMDRIRSQEFDPREDCGSLCLQHKTNEVLFDLIHNKISIEELKTLTKFEKPQHVNFI